MTKDEIQCPSGYFNDINFAGQCTGNQLEVQTIRSVRMLADSSISSNTGFYFGVAREVYNIPSIIVAR